jgi:Tfp pilus assembly protein PilF
VSKDRRNNLLLFAIPFLATFVVYFLTVCRTVYSGDSGEFSLDIPTLGIAHPPGYPLLLFLGKVFLTIFPGNVAYLLNIFSALLASLAAGIGAFVARDLIFPDGKRDELQSVIVSILAAIAWGYSNALWATAVGIEVYSLGACLFLLSLFSLLRFHETHQQKYLLFSIYIFCLGLTDHLTIAALAIPILYPMIMEKAPLRIWILSIFFFIITISAYLYIPLRSAHNPIADWDHPVNLAGVIEHITAKRYRPFISGFWIGNYFENLWRSIRIAAEQFPLWMGVFGLAAIFLTRRLARPVKLIVVAIILFNFLTVAIYDIPDIDQYYLPSFFLATVGLAMLVNWIGGTLLHKGRQIAIIVVMAVIAAATLAANYSQNDQSHDRLTYIYGMDILNSVPQNSLLISIGDNANSAIYYLHYIEGIRSDLEIYDAIKTYGMIKDRLGIKRSDGGRIGDELCLKMLYDNPDRSYLVKEHMLIKGTPLDYQAMKLTPDGLVYGIGNRPAERDIWNRLEIPPLNDFSNKLDFKGVTMLANLYLCRGEDRLAAEDTVGARNDFEEATRVAAHSGEAAVHNSLGLFFRHIHQADLSEREYTVALKSWHLTAFERANIYVNLGNLKKDGGDFDQAIEFYNKALGINRDNKEAKYDLDLTNAYLNLSKGRFQEAAAAFENALTYSGADPRLIFNLGVIYDQKLGDREKAIYNYRRFAELAPNLPEGKAARRRISELSVKTDTIE